eukprot:TRINITY_DN2272_c0_g1_i1.p1 TRINITY_DN2272_c0_g1~~TRINITY_DN2272_c0_g1_i1.p1  ORF type:complete len:235 (+),score=63.34 TRINITY_DN2272_c0_g1_i1:142-846(+)
MADGDFGFLSSEPLSAEHVAVFKQDFAEFDLDSSGLIDRAEVPSLLQKQLARAPSEAEVQSTLEMFDTNQDGGISFEEYMDAVMGDAWKGYLRSIEASEDHLGLSPVPKKNLPPSKKKPRAPKPVKPPPSAVPVPAEYTPAGPHTIALEGHCHCARGPKRCSTCEVWEADRNWMLYSVDGEHDPEAACPTKQFRDDQANTLFHAPYVVVGAFGDEIAARAFADKFGDCVLLEEA